jgi:hypothetical protein
LRNGTGIRARSACTAGRNTGPADGFRGALPGLELTRSDVFWAFCGTRARHGPVAWKNTGPRDGFWTGPPGLDPVRPLGAFAGTRARHGHGTGKNGGPEVGGGGGMTAVPGMSDAIATPVRTRTCRIPDG